MEAQDAILKFWFGANSDAVAIAQAQSKLWWAKDGETDAAIKLRFEADVMKAACGELDAWADTPSGCLALILLTDQFPRNIYRDCAQAFAYDALANAWCKAGIRQGFDQKLRPIERVFFYLPLEHAESLVDQEQAVRLFERLAAEAAPSERETFDGFLDFARRHARIIARFGRFPHRNAMLGRASTPQEIEFLKEKGSSF